MAVAGSVSNKSEKKDKGKKSAKTANAAKPKKTGPCSLGKTAAQKAASNGHPKSFVGLVLGLLTLGLNSGCLQPNMNPLERSFNTTMTEVIKPAISEAITKLDPDSAQLQGQASLINPGYVIEWQATAGPATCGKIAISVSGVSANIAGATQASPAKETAKNETPDSTPPSEPAPGGS